MVIVRVREFVHDEITACPACRRDFVR